MYCTIEFIMATELISMKTELFIIKSELQNFIYEGIYFVTLRKYEPR